MKGEQIITKPFPPGSEQIYSRRSNVKSLKWDPNMRSVGPLIT